MFNYLIKKTVYTPQNKALFQRRFLSDVMRKSIQGAVESAPVVLFMKGTPEFPACRFSKLTIELLSQQGVDPAKFVAFNVLEDPELRNGIKEFSEWPTIPQLYVNKEFVGGCDIITEMSKNGELADLLEKEDVLVPQ
ncbi:monothiol glutaredoxin grx5 [Hanseniaspora opuntiae]